MKRFLQAAAVAVSVVYAALAAAAISFDGPKITDSKIDGPGDFAVYQFIGNDKVDAAVPQLRKVWGLDNKNNWASVAPNTYFNQNAHTDGGYNRQIVAGQFDGDAGVRDLLVADDSVLHLCYNYSGGACGAESDPIPVKIDEERYLRIWAVGVADFNGDGKDDVAVIGYEPKSWVGYLAVFAGSGAGGANPLGVPYYLKDIKNGIPLSLAIGQFGGDAKLDLVVATMTGNQALEDGAFGNTFINGGAGFTLTDHTFEFPKKECYHPSGLIAYDPDGAGNSDLLLTCYDFYETGCNITETTAAAGDGPIGACYAIYGSGPVISLKNSGDGSSFAVQQTLTDLKFPYTSTVGDYDGDSKLDVAVASNGGQSVVTFVGTGPFQVDVASRNDIATLSYKPKFIQTHDMNGDTLPDLILSADQVEFPVQEPQVVGIADTVIGWDRFDSLTYRAAAAIGGTYYSGDYGAYAQDVSASNFAEFSGFRSYASESPNHSTHQYLVNAEGPTSSVLVTDRTDLAVATHPLGEVGVDQALPTDGVLVLINHRPTVSIEDPECGGGEIDYRCTASEGRTIVECSFASSDSSLSSTPAVAGPGGKEWTGQVTLPNDQGVHSFTVTAKDDLGTVHTGEFTVDYSKCPGSGGNACPAKPIEKQLSPKDPVMICAFESDPNLAALNSGKVVTWTQVGEEGGLDVSLLTVQGQCLVGPKVPLSFEQNRTIELKYSVEPDGPKDCPARMVYPKAVVEGSGLLSCSLSESAPRSTALGLLAMTLLGGAAWLGLRRDRVDE
ncbi:MAG TPA: VCBS repeat-containing protein [bacterium]|nr:VCBS repeat-containing protein [bacterium]